MFNPYKSGEAQRSGTRRCNPARGQMKSGESDCTHELASDVWREEGGGRKRKKEEGRGRRKKDVLLKSNNPHLAGGEKHDNTMWDET